MPANQTCGERLSEQYRHYQRIAVEARTVAAARYGDAKQLWYAISAAAVSISVRGHKADRNYYPRERKPPTKD